MLRTYRNIKVLSLDAMNTLICLKESPGEVYSKFAKNYFNINIKASILNKNFIKSFRFLEQKYPCYAFNASKAEFWWNQVVRNSFPKANILENILFLKF